MSTPVRCSLCGYLAAGDTSKARITDLFRHQQAAHVDPLKVKA